MREVHVSAITDTVKKLCMEANWNLGGEMLRDRANRLGIGPQGYGGDTTSRGIHVLTYPCHITSLPVAVTIECHAHRHKEATL